MNNADMLIHLHPNLNPGQQTILERRLEESNGINFAEFSLHAYPHTLMVRYDPDVIAGMQILDVVREYDPLATRVGL